MDTINVTTGDEGPFDICYGCERRFPPNTLMDVNEIDFDIYCQDCRPDLYKESEQIMNWEITSAKWCNDQHIRHFGVAMVYIDQGRPFNEGDLMGDFAWRREHEPALTADEVLSLVREKLVEEGVKGEFRIKYDRKAGCGGCPCSPGYVVYNRAVGECSCKPRRRLNIWVGLKKLEVTA
jgi:hypothetical protein